MKKNFYLICFLISSCLFSQSNKILSGPMISYIDARTAQIWMLLESDAKTVEIDVKNYDNTKFLNYTFEVKNPHKFKELYSRNYSLGVIATKYRIRTKYFC